MRPPVVHIAALLVSAAVNSASGQSQPAPTTPPDTVVRDSLAMTTARPDTAKNDGQIVTAAPELKTVKVVGRNERGSGYLRFETGTATKTPTLLRNIPQAVTVINRA
ncbi:MAG TPA: hypothetical protein VK571_05985, partial [Gemmatimonadaceae bacterium]|nr:hypothetical protein [Gemmatimonadaceae bacterium]